MTHRFDGFGILVAFEGIDGAGKSTQVATLARRLRQHGLDVLATREPTDGPWGRKIRQSALTGRLPREQELEAFIEDRREHLELEVLPALGAGQIVIVDRYVLSTVAYQGARGFDPKELASSNAFAPPADLCLVFDLEPELGLSRVNRRGVAADLFEKLDELRIARHIFTDPELLAVVARRHHILNAALPSAALEQQIALIVGGYLGIELPPLSTSDPRV
jgi:dTMP kinase